MADRDPARMPRDSRGRGNPRLRFSPEETAKIEHAAMYDGVQTGNGLMRFMREAIMRYVELIETQLPLHMRHRAEPEDQGYEVIEPAEESEGAESERADDSESAD